jgi:hypothetical protein
MILRSAQSNLSRVEPFAGVSSTVAQDTRRIAGAQVAMPRTGTGVRPAFGFVEAVPIVAGFIGGMTGPVHPPEQVAKSQFVGRLRGTVIGLASTAASRSPMGAQLSVADAPGKVGAAGGGGLSTEDTAGTIAKATPWILLAVVGLVFFAAARR